MKHHPIENQMQRIAQPLNKRVEVIWNNVIDRWQVYEITYGRIMTLNGQKRNLRLLWTIQTENGSYRHPSDADMRKMIMVAEHSKQLWNENVEQLCDDLDADGAAAEKRVSKGAADRIEYITKEVAERVFRAPKRTSLS